MLKGTDGHSDKQHLDKVKHLANMYMSKISYDRNLPFRFLSQLFCCDDATALELLQMDRRYSVKGRLSLALDPCPRCRISSI